MADESLGLLQGTLDVLILKALAYGPAHGYAVARWIRETSDEALSVEDGALYTALHRLHRRGWLEAEWGISPAGRRAKFYALTARGRKQLEQEARSWNRYAEAIDKVLEAEGPGPLPEPGS